MRLTIDYIFLHITYSILSLHEQINEEALEPSLVVILLIVVVNHIGKPKQKEGRCILKVNLCDFIDSFQTVDH